MFVPRVPTVVSLGQLDDDSAAIDSGPLSPDAPVAQCAHVRLPKVSFAFQEGRHCQRVRSFGELRDLEDWEKRRPDITDVLQPPTVSSDDDLSAAPVDLPEAFAPADEPKSLMEETLLGLWEMCAESGLFRYDVTACETKPVPGLYGFVAQLNEGRATKKRPTEFRVDQVVQPFDEQKFNFLKARVKEVLFQFDAEASGETIFEEDSATGANPGLVLINISPIEYGHVLLVPRVMDRLPQLITEDSMLLALQFAAAAENPYFRVGYNSLGAYATINHLHFQAYFLLAPYPVERAPTMPLEPANSKHPGVKVAQLSEYPVKGFVFEMSSDLQEMAGVLARACTYMQRANIPHNLLICDSGARVFLWPQCYAEKQAKGVVAEDILSTGVDPAAFEIAGHVVLKNRDDYDNMTEARAWRMLSEVSVAEERFQEIARQCLE
ncbi:unnamed protein product [Ostreobium quekettii]|uniref:GDP-D-glucose phosphorylase 1 n=1 Tax=Ostreobium quekettii TaxID=121088 RepID=A0A8S1J3W3_9CHLO|nr:unnamed protein product [Ostreobium quekettii]|eukprot:evm.model.scf_1951EXC.3 EVM.evm.TU.scf_1951EXC.3   scf_1951EXC:13184-16514(+)